MSARSAEVGFITGCLLPSDCGLVGALLAAPALARGRSKQRPYDSPYRVSASCGHLTGCRLASDLGQRLVVGRPGHPLFGDDRGHEASWGDVEGWMGRRDAVGSHRASGKAQDLTWRTLFNRDLGA